MKDPLAGFWGMWTAMFYLTLGNLLKFKWKSDATPVKVLGRRPACKPAFRISRLFHQLSPTQKCIYTWPIRKFLGVLKSYESESFISALYVVRSEVLVPLWYPSFEKIFGVGFRFSF